MAVFTFVCRLSRGTWTAKQHAGQSNLQESAASTFELQRKLNSLALLTAGPGGVSSSFSYVTPTSAVYQVIIGGGVGGTFLGGGVAGAPSGAGGGDAAPPVVDDKVEEKKEEEESDDDMGFSLFD